MTTPTPTLTRHPLVYLGGWIAAPFKAAYRVVAWPFKKTYAGVKYLVTPTPEPTLDDVLAPFKKAVAQLSAVEAKARDKEQNLREGIAATTRQADTIAKEVQQAQAAAQKMSALLGL